MAEQDREYRDRLASWQRRLAREGTSARALRLRKAADAKAKDEAFAREAVDMFDFRIVGRDTWQGQPAIVVTFTPRTNVSPRSREGRVARAFSGRAWIHEFDYEVMNVEAKAVDDVIFGWDDREALSRIDRAVFPSAVRRRVAAHRIAIRGDGQGADGAKGRHQVRADYYDYRPFDYAELPARLGWEP